MILLTVMPSYKCSKISTASAKREAQSEIIIYTEKNIEATTVAMTKCLSFKLASIWLHLNLNFFNLYKTGFSFVFTLQFLKQTQQTAACLHCTFFLFHFFYDVAV